MNKPINFIVKPISGYSKYVKSVTKTIASLGFLYLARSSSLLNSDQGSYLFWGELHRKKNRPNQEILIPDWLITSHVT